MYCSAIFTVYFLTPSRRTADGIRSDGGRNPIGRRTESSRGCSCLSCTNKADRHVRSVDALLTRLVRLLFGWCTYCSVGALETSAPPKRRQHLCRSEICGTTSQARVSSVGATGRGCSCLSCTNKASGESIPTEYAEHTEPSGGDVPPTDRHRCAQIRKVWHSCHTHATNRAND